MTPIPPGHNRESWHDIEIEGLPAGSAIAICSPVILGMPAVVNALIRHCNSCGTEVWRSPRAPEGMYILCEFCLDELDPGWQDR